VAAAVGAAIAVFRPAAAQQGKPGQCLLEFRGSRAGGSPTTLARFPSAPGRSNTFAGGGVDAFCSNTDQRVTSDSAEHYEDQRLLLLLGRVHYTEQRVEMTADRVTYYMGEERLVAEGNVVGRTSTGTRFRGPRAVYLRAKPGLRSRSRLDAGGRPDTWISGADAGTSPDAPDSTHVIADSLISDNDSLVYAIGHVNIIRTDLTATSDSAMIDQGREIASLRRTPRVEGVGEHKFTLQGVAIDVYSRNREAERVLSSDSARATSDNVVLKADTIDLRLAARQLVRAIAWGRSRALASQPGRDLIADSIDVRMPGQVLHSMTAIRRARAESAPDTLKLRSKERDWFAGDTIVASFDTSATRDTASAPLRSLVARGNAQSYQQSARDGVPLPDTSRVINYVAGTQIVADFDQSHALERVRVTGQVAGVIVQPSVDTARKAAPTKRPDQR
jgi:lipopolysaccharide export system protein LptA